MKTQAMSIPAFRISNSRYGITERKKEELDLLSIEVIDTQHDVDQFTAIVTSLTAKLANFQIYLTTAYNNRAVASTNKVLIDQMVQTAIDLQNNSSIAFDEMGQADLKTKILAKSINSVINKLIYSAEMIDKLSNLLIRKKALNPLISDELISLVATSGKDANNAVALTLVALNATFASMASNMESESALALENAQAIQFLQMLTGKLPPKNLKDAAENKDVELPSLQKYLTDAYDTAKTNYIQTEAAFKITTNQLNEAQANLNKAQVKLRSLQSGFAAANAAALAS